jgi:anti-sigma B factor antagonist
MNLQVSVTSPATGTALVEISGDIDVETTQQLRSTLHEVANDERVRIVVIGLEGVEFIDSSGLGVLMGCSRRLRLRGQGNELRLVCSRPNLLRVFEITGLDTVLPIFAATPDALKDA